MAETEARIEETGSVAVAVAVADRAPVANALFAGAAAGVAGALLMGLWAMMLAALTGYGAWFPFRVVGATLVGATALVGGAETIAYGWALHLLVSAAFGLLFGLLSLRTVSYGGALTAAIAYSLAVLLFMTYVIAPFANPVLLQRITLMPASWFLMHVIYGAGLSLTPAMLRYSRTITLPRAFVRSAA